MSKYMRMMVFFDLPVKTLTEKRNATAFRKFLISDGYCMVQYSVYVRICNGSDAVEKHKSRLYANVPDNGSIRLLVVTEKQYEAMELILGDLTEADESFQSEQLSFF